MHCRHEKTREKRADRGEYLDQAVASRQLVGLVIARTHVHDGREVAGFEEAHASRMSDTKDAKGGSKPFLQEAEDVELVHVLDTGMSECENCPGKLEECDIKRRVDLCSVNTRAYRENQWDGEVPV